MLTRNYVTSYTNLKETNALAYFSPPEVTSKEFYNFDNRRKTEPIFVSMVDNNKATGRYTQRKGAIQVSVSQTFFFFIADDKA